MPLYEFQCSGCQKIHEVMQKFSDPLMETCPDCGAPVTQLLSRTSFALKGSGWYTSDYKRKSESSSGKPAETSGAASSDSKPSDSKPGDSKSGDSKT